MKVYFHFQFGISLNYGTVTAVVDNDDSDDNGDIKSTLNKVCKQMFNLMKIDISITMLEVTTENNASIALDTNMKTQAHGADFYVKVNDDANKSKIKFERTVISKQKASAVVTQKNGSTNENVEVTSTIQRASKYLSKKRHDLALAEYREVLAVTPNNFDALFGIAYIFFKAKRFKESLPFFEKLTSMNSTDHTLLLDYSRVLTECKDSQKAVSVLSRCINDLKRSNQQVQNIYDANVGLAEALESMQQYQHAFQLFLNVSQLTEKQHVVALLGYARVGFKLNMVVLDDVFIVLLNAIAQKKNDKVVQRFLTDMVQIEGGFEAMKKQMHDAWMDPSVIVYIATIFRENGALNECLNLLNHALTLSSKSIDVVLLMVHLYENVCNFTEELKLAYQFFDGKLDRHVLRKVDLSPFMKIIKLILKEEHVELDHYVLNQLSKENQKHPVSGAMADVELQLLALYFTIVKSCFVMGFIKIIPAFIKLLDPLFITQENLHLTLIRNEQAYYSCIRQIYSEYPPSKEVIESTKSLYFIGDSHTLPLAWRSVECQGSSFTIKPILITGLKIWHLRKEENFYTKISFQNAIKNIPTGSWCIFGIGEIDCREGIRRAVEMCYYESEELCAAKLVDIYIHRLLELQKGKKLKIFIHPVPAILQETARYVHLFNKHLKERVSSTPKLTWLDFIHTLLDEKDGIVKNEYQFDGVHLHPKYIDVLAQCLHNVV